MSGIVRLEMMPVDPLRNVCACGAALQDGIPRVGIHWLAVPVQGIARQQRALLTALDVTGITTHPLTHDRGSLTTEDNPTFSPNDFGLAEPKLNQLLPSVPVIGGGRADLP